MIIKKARKQNRGGNSIKTIEALVTEIKALLAEVEAEKRLGRLGLPRNT